MPSLPSPDDFAQHAPWVRRLATSLVRGADADDLVQETWLAMLRKPPPEGVPVRPWLAGVLKNLQRMRRRGERRRVAREAEVVASTDDVAPAADATLEQARAERTLGELLDAIDEPYRSTLKLRYYEGLSAADIARRQGTPAGTVRWRLKIGLDKLREALDRESGGDRGRWRAALLPLLLGETGTRPTLRARWFAGAGPLAVLGPVLALIGVLAGVALVAFSRAGAPATHAAATTALGSNEATSTARPGAAAPRPRALEDREATALDMLTASVERDGSDGGTIEGYIIDQETSRGIPDAQMTFASEHRTVTAMTDASGRFHLDAPEPGLCALATVTASGYLPFAPDWGQSPLSFFARPGLRLRDVTVFLSGSFEETGVVLAPSGEPVAGAAVRILDADQFDQALQPLADGFVTDARGEFVFQAPMGAIVEARHGAYGPVRAWLDSVSARQRRFELRLRPPDPSDATFAAARIAGRVVDARGEPMVGAVVRTEYVVQRGDAAPGPRAQARTEEAGRFTLEGLDPGTYTLEAAHGGGVAARFEGIATGDAEVTLRLVDRGSIAGRVVEAASGEPTAAFTIIVEQGSPFESRTVATRVIFDGEGRFRVDGLEPGPYRVTAKAQARAYSREIEVIVPTASEAPAAPIALSIPAGGLVMGRVISAETGEPIAGAEVGTPTPLRVESSAVQVSFHTVTDEAGGFEVPGMVAGLQTLHIEAEGYHTRMFSGLRVEDGATLGPITVTLAVRHEGEPQKTLMGGLGARYIPAVDAMLIIQVQRGSGADEVGLAVGDAVVSLDGIPVTTLGPWEFIQQSRSPQEGTPARVGIRHGNRGPVVELLVPRRIVLD